MFFYKKKVRRVNRAMRAHEFLSMSLIVWVKSLMCWANPEFSGEALVSVRLLGGG